MKKIKDFPNISLTKEKLEDVKNGNFLDMKKWELCDKILVPSKYCKETATKMGADPKKLSLVPYGIKMDSFNLKSNLRIGRILFVGEISLRKGIHYFAEASNLKERKKL